MAINALSKIGNLYSVNNIKFAQARFDRGAASGVNSVKDRELHPAMSSTELCSTPFANKLDLLV